MLMFLVVFFSFFFGMIFQVMSHQIRQVGADKSLLSFPGSQFRHNLIGEEIGFDFVIFCVPDLIGVNRVDYGETVSASLALDYDFVGVMMCQFSFVRPTTYSYLTCANLKSGQSANGE